MLFSWIFKIFCFIKYKQYNKFTFYFVINLFYYLKDNKQKVLLDPIFIYSLRSLPCWISFFHLKTFKVHFHGVPFLHYFLVCKIYVYLSRIRPSNLLTQISFFYIKFAIFSYITCFVPCLIPILFQSYGPLLIFISRNVLRSIT